MIMFLRVDGASYVPKCWYYMYYRGGSFSIRRRWLGVGFTIQGLRT